MLGDSQIGKTSLMVKYVEGHFDEDYIQTLGMCPTRNIMHKHAPSGAYAYTIVIRRQLHGEDHHCATNIHHILAMGSWRAARVREHVATSVQ